MSDHPCVWDINCALFYDHDIVFTLDIRKLVAHKTSLDLPLFIEVPVPSQESEQSCIFVCYGY